MGITFDVRGNPKHDLELWREHSMKNALHLADPIRKEAWKDIVSFYKDGKVHESGNVDYAWLHGDSIMAENETRKYGDSTLSHKNGFLLVAAKLIQKAMHILMT